MIAVVLLGLDVLVSVLGDCYASGHISPLPLVARGIRVMSKGVDSLEGPETAVAGYSHVPQGDHGRHNLTGIGSAMCGIFG